MGNAVVVDSPVGPLTLRASDAGLVSVSFGAVPSGADPSGAVSSDDDGARPAGEGSPSSAEAHLAQAERELAEYFGGRRREFTVPLDRRAARGFRGLAQDRLRAIPYARTWTYAQVAAAAGSPGAVRAVGSACASNPLPILVPCHRVIRSDGGLGGYAGGLGVKRALLDLEGSVAALR